MYVCICKGITDHQIRAAVHQGADSMRAVRQSLGVASQCGKCGSLARDIMREAQEQLQTAEAGLFYAAG